jgi:hypothetical protein
MSTSNRINKNSRRSAKVSRDDQGEPMRDDYNDDQQQQPIATSVHTECHSCGQLDLWCQCDPLYEASLNEMDMEIAAYCATVGIEVPVDHDAVCAVWDKIHHHAAQEIYEATTPESEHEQEQNKLTTILQQFANDDRIHVKRYREGHNVTLISADGTSDIVEGWLSSQDMAEGWIKKYSLWTEDQGNGYISINLMIGSNVVPSLPEFAGCSNHSLCNLDDFHSFTITIKRELVQDFPM